MSVLKLGPSATVVLNMGGNNDVTPTPAIGTINRLLVDTSDGVADITGILAAADGQLLWIINAGPNDLNLMNEDVASVATNRLDGSADLTIPPNASMLIYYDTAIQTGRWVMGV